MTSEAPGDRLRRLRRTDSETKAAQVRAALDATIITGGPFTVTEIARKARVSRRFIYDHPELRAEIDLKASEAVGRFSGRLVASARVTAASLLADTENYKAENRRLRQRIRSLETRLSKVLGEEVAAELSGQGVLVAEKSLRDEIDALQAKVADLKDELRRTNEDLQGARHANRELMVDLNRRGPRP